MASYPSTSASEDRVVSANDLNIFKAVIISFAASIGHTDERVRLRCSASWLMSVEAMTTADLRWNFKFLLQHSSPSTIVRFHEQLFHISRLAVMVAGRYIMDRNMHNDANMNKLMENYREHDGKLFYYLICM